MPTLASKYQKMLIHRAKEELKIPEEVYREEILPQFGVTSSVDLSEAEAKELLQKFGEQGWKPRQRRKAYGSKRHGWGQQTHNDLEHRERRGNQATPKQLRFIEAMWREHPAVRDRSDKGLRGYCERITGISDPRWLTHRDVQKLIEAIKKLKD